MPVMLATQEAEIRRIEVRGQSWQEVRIYLKNTQQAWKRADGVGQVVESACL
jgi:hypothetical protein